MSEELRKWLEGREAQARYVECKTCEGTGREGSTPCRACDGYGNVEVKAPVDCTKQKEGG